MNWKLQIGVFTLSLVIILSACQSDSDTPFDPNLGNAPVNPSEQTLANIINEIRENGQKCSGIQYISVPALSFDETLNQIAKSHAQYMNNLDELTHIGENNSTIGDRAIAVGYDYSTITENLAKGYADEASVVNAWKNSEGHCENMLHPAVREMGVGTSGAYWVMVFGVE